MNKINNQCSSLLKSKLLKSYIREKNKISLNKYKLNNSENNSQKNDNSSIFNNNLCLNLTFQNHDKNINQSNNKIKKSILESYSKNFLKQKKNIKFKNILDISEKSKSKEENCSKNNSPKNLFLPKLYKINNEKYQFNSKKRLLNYKPFWFENAKDLNKEKDDKYMPIGYKWIQNLIKKHTSNIDNSVLERENIKKHNSESDIFFFKKNFENQLNTERKIIKTNNIINLFNLNKNNQELNNQNNNNVRYTSDRESNSFWQPKNNMPSFINYSSSTRHLFNEKLKNIGKTKKEIENECHKINPYSNYTFKKNALCEFLNLTRVYSPNPNKEYLKVLKENPRAFFKKSDITKELNYI